jgi:hypothetical protein
MQRVAVAAERDGGNYTVYDEQLAPLRYARLLALQHIQDERGSFEANSWIDWLNGGAIDSTLVSSPFCIVLHVDRKRFVYSWNCKLERS